MAILLSPSLGYKVSRASQTVSTGPPAGTVLPGKWDIAAFFVDMECHDHLNDDDQAATCVANSVVNYSSTDAEQQTELKGHPATNVCRSNGVQVLMWSEAKVCHSNGVPLGIHRGTLSSPASETDMD
jgi:hypothetical protein